MLGEVGLQKLNDWSKQTFFLGITDKEDPEAPRKDWRVLFQDGNSTIWNTGGGVYAEKIYPDGTKRLTRRLSKAEIKEIEKKWPKVGFLTD